MIAYYDFTLVANAGMAELQVPGSYFKYVEGVAGGADARIIVTADGGLRAVLKPGQGVRLPAVVGRWRVQNYLNAGTIVGEVAIGVGALEDATITGDVNVIDNGLSRTLLGSGFLGTVSSGVVAAQYPRAQLWNPAGSGKNLFVSKLAASVSSAMTVSVVSTSVQAAGAGAATFNKRFGAGVGVGLLKYEQSVSLPVSSYAAAFYCAANSVLWLEFKEPVMVPPSFGLAVDGQAVNVSVTANYEWIESPL